MVCIEFQFYALLIWFGFCLLTVTDIAVLWLQRDLEFGPKMSAVNVSMKSFSKNCIRFKLLSHLVVAIARYTTCSWIECVGVWLGLSKRKWSIISCRHTTFRNYHHSRGGEMPCSISRMVQTEHVLCGSGQGWQRCLPRGFGRSAYRKWPSSRYRFVGCWLWQCQISRHLHKCRVIP